MKEITKDNVGMIKTRILEALLPVGETLGLSFMFGSGDYNSNNFITKLEIMVDNEDGIAMSREATDFQERAWEYGLNSGHLGATFITGEGSEYKIIGCKIKNRKYPIIAERVDSGNRYKFSAEIVKNCLVPIKEEL